jgi:glycosyltransferase involved in cell wall biosynthesis
MITTGVCSIKRWVGSGGKQVNKPKYRVTVFTPCYNAAKTIHRVWESLNQQTFRDFEWITVIDEADDNIVSILNGYKDTADFSMKIISSDAHMGKMWAWNQALEVAEGEFIICADADDRLTDDSLQILIDAWESIPTEERKDFWAIYSHCRDQHGDFVGTKYPADPFDGHYYETFFKHKVTGEKHIMHRTDIMKASEWCTVDYYVPESHKFSALGNKYKARHINRTTRIYYLDQEDSVCDIRDNKLKYIVGRDYSYRCFINENFKYLRYHPRLILSRLLLYGRYSRHAGISFPAALAKLEGPKPKLAFLASYPAAYAIVVLDRLLKKV